MLGLDQRLRVLGGHVYGVVPVDRPPEPGEGTPLQELVLDEDWPGLAEAAARVEATGRTQIVDARFVVERGRWRRVSLMRPGVEGGPMLLLCGVEQGDGRARAEGVGLADEPRGIGSAEVVRKIRDIAHAFNNHLATIGGACRVLQLDDSLSPSVREDLEEIQRATGRAATLARELLTIGREQARTVEPAEEGSVEPSRPAAVVAETAPRGPGPSATAASGSPATILLVDDDASARRVAERMLQMDGYHVLTANDGMEAMTRAEAHGGRIDLLLSDVVMPRMDGRTLFELLRQSRPQLRVLFVSGFDDESVGETKPLDERARFLQKPFLMEALLSVVRELLAEGAALREWDAAR